MSNAQSRDPNKVVEAIVRRGGGANAVEASMAKAKVLSEQAEAHRALFASLASPTPDLPTDG